jgi:hypothetical protein
MTKTEVQAQKIQNYKELVRLKDAYIDLLADEIKELIGMAVVHNWKSRRANEGERLRNEIQKLKQTHGL